MVSLSSTGTPLREIAAPPNSCRFRPVAVMMMSACSSSPEASLMPVFVKRSIVSVTTSALPR